MKASMTIAIVLSIIPLTTNAQNYQTVQSNEIHYFIDQSHTYFLASKVENVELLNGDSIFYTFQTMREDESLPADDPCKYYLGPAWTGEKTIVKTNGQNIFFNKYNEPIVIETQAALNDTFLVYTYESGDWIKGYVSNELQLSVFGEMDNVKIIKLISNIELTLDNPRFIISENHGFIEQFAFFSFPEPYTGAASITGDNDFPEGYSGNFELVGIDTSGFSKPTTLDLYDYGIGDQFKLFSSVENEDGSITETFTQRKVVNRFLWEEQDSLVYFVEDASQVTRYPSNGASETTITEPELTVITYNNLNSWNTAYLPEEFNGTDGWAALHINDCGDVEEVTRKQAIYYDGVSPCLQVNEFGPNMIFTAINGIGWLDPIGQTEIGQVMMSEMLYYMKADGSECGSNQFLDIQIESKPEMKVYPNPSSGDLYLELDESSPDKIITVIDQQGRIVRIWKKHEDQAIYLDISELEDGVYTLVVESNDLVSKSNIVKY